MGDGRVMIQIAVMDIACVPQGSTRGRQNMAERGAADNREHKNNGPATAYSLMEQVQIGPVTAINNV